MTFTPRSICFCRSSLVVPGYGDSSLPVTGDETGGPELERSGQCCGSDGPGLIKIESVFTVTTKPAVSSVSTNSASACFGVSGCGAMIVTCGAARSASELSTMFLHVKPSAQVTTSRIDVSGLN